MIIVPTYMSCGSYINLDVTAKKLHRSRNAVVARKQCHVTYALYELIVLEHSICREWYVRFCRNFQANIWGTRITYRYDFRSKLFNIIFSRYLIVREKPSKMTMTREVKFMDFCHFLDSLNSTYWQSDNLKGLEHFERFCRKVISK